MATQPVREWYKIVTNKAATGSKGGSKGATSAEVLIYDFIDPFGVSAQDFVNDIKALDVDNLDVRINSPGGSAFDGIAIYNALKRHPATVTTYNDGLAASAASFIAQAGDTRITSKYAETMVHGPSSIVLGTAADMRSTADQLDRLSGNMAQLYADATGGEFDDWLAAMESETWYTGAEAVKAGLFDKVDDTDTGDDKKPASKKAGVAAAAAAFDYSAFRYAGREAAPDPFDRKETPVAKQDAKRNRMGVPAATAASLGPDPDDDPNELLASLDATLDEASKLAGPVDRASVPPEVGQVLDLVVAAEALVDQLMDLCGVYDPDDDDGDNSATADGSQSPVTKATARKGTSTMADETADKAGAKPAAPQAAAPGTVVVDAATLAALQEQARLGVKAHETLQAQAYAKVIDAALDKGKILPSRSEHYMAMMKADPEGTTALLESFPEQAAIPLTEIGHAAAQSDAGPTASATNTDNPLYKNWMAI